MSLVKSPEMSEKKLAANRRNQARCNGPVPDERRERIRAALRRFGYNVEAEEMAMRALGEDPADFQELLEELWGEYNPASASQEGVVIRLARGLWLMNRTDRMQEGLTVRQALKVSSGRQDQVHAQMMRLKMTEERLARLAQSVARPHYVTSSEDLEKMKNLHQEGVLKDMGEIALALFYQLKPDEDEDGPEDYEQAQRVVAQVKEIFGITMPEYAIKPNFGPNWGQPAESPPAATAAAEEKEEEEKEEPPPSRFSAAEWEVRERPRQLLENILTRQVDSCKAQRKAILKDSVKGPSPYERAAEIAPTHRDALLMRRLQDSQLREVRRLTYLLLKIKRYERQREGLEKPAALHDVSEKEGVSSE